MPTSEEDLQKIREENEKLREKIIAANSKQADNEANAQREYDALQLNAENERLKAELQAAEAQAKVSVARDGAASVLESAKAQLAAAEAQVKTTPGIPVDVNDPENIKQYKEPKPNEEPDSGSVPASEAILPADARPDKNGGNS